MTKRKGILFGANALHNAIVAKKSFLCVGLDPVVAQLPLHLRVRCIDNTSTAEAFKTFCIELIKSTLPFAVAYKPNTAFFEVLGADGYRVLAEVIATIPANVLVIADAKRGDIGNTSKAYKEAIIDNLGADAITVAPYMGRDSVNRFIAPSSWAIVLGLTSNEGAIDFQLLKLENGRYLFEEVIAKVTTWGTIDNTMFVVGATRVEHLEIIRKVVPNHFLLVPGVGAQGGSLASVIATCLTDKVGLLINASRSIIYASASLDYAQAAAMEAQKLQMEMAELAGL